MSNLRLKLQKIAEDYQKTEDGKYIDPETGEILDKPPVNKEDQSYEDKVKNVMYDTGKQTASDVYKDPKYYNKWGKVSPFNIIFIDNMNQLYGMDPKSIADGVVNIIEGLNQTYANDETYDYVSQSYLNELKINLAKKKTTDQVVQYLTNIYFAGVGMGSGSKKRYASLNEALEGLDLSNKELLKKIVVGLNVIINS